MSTVQVSTEKVGARVYVTGNTYPIKQQLKDAGCKWDGDRKQWWIGAAKADAIASVVGQLDGKEAPKEDLSSRRVFGKVEYKGRTYYVIGEASTGKLRLTVLDGSIDFWAAPELCKWVKRYEVQRRFAGYGRGEVETYMTLGKIRDFIADQKNPHTARGQCTECGAWGARGDSCSECGGEGSYV